MEVALPNRYVKPSLDELTHFGVKGMRWGHRKPEEESDGRRSASRPEVAAKNLRKTPEIDKIKSQGISRAQKAQKYQDRANGHKKDIKELEEKGFDSPIMHMKYPGGMRNDAAAVLMYGATRKQLLEHEKNVRQMAVKRNERAAQAKLEGRMTNGQKLAIGAVFAIGALGAAYLGSKYMDEIKRAGSAGQNIKVDEFMKRFMGSDMRLQLHGSKPLSELHDEDFSLPIGHVFKRISGNPEQALRPYVFASCNDDDLNRYKAILPKYFSWIQEDKTYEIEMHAKTEIKSPSEKKRVEVFIDMLATDWATKGDYRHVDLSTPEKRTKQGLRLYQQFALQGAGKTPLGVEYFKRLQTMGYNAWIDDNDRGKLSDTPIVLLNAPSVVERVGARLVDKAEQENARSVLRELANRR